MISTAICTQTSLLEIPLHENWQFRQSGKAVWQPATVPGCVHTDLLANGLIEDPFYRTNEKKQQWIDKVDWEYQTEFFAGADLLAHQHLELFFEGLDTYAEVSLNGKRILSSDNMFREWAVNVKPFLKKGKNTLHVLLKSPIQEGLKLLDAHGYPLPAVNDQSENGELGDKRVSVFTRKAGYHYGWDWGPRFVTSGIWRPLTLRAWNDARIENVHIVQQKLDDQVASLMAVVEIKAGTPGDYLVGVNVNEAPQSKVSRLVFLKNGLNTLELNFTIENPKRWWTNGLGEPFLYHISTELLKNGQQLDQQIEATGLRTVRIVQEPDALGKSFYVELNGVPVFMKGANYIPSDNFLNRVTPEEYDRILRLAVDANMNMLRIWGGGIYENDVFYDLCDRYGILIWQDFMFACSMYPGDAAFLENVRREAVDNVRRLRNHPSVALWCGNNEIDVAWSQYNPLGGWGWKQLYNEKQRAEIWHAYDTLFHKILPEVVKQNDPDRFYWPSSPLADYGKHAGYDTQSGDIHYWGVWHGLHRFEDFRKYVGRFMSEYGFQSFPEFKTVKTYTQPQDWDIESEVMAAHQRSGIGNLRIREYMSWYYRMPKDFERFLYVGQVLQAEAIKSAIETHRRHMPHNMGTLYWQINDCWPVASWSSTDYYRRWKALHYFVRKAFSEVLVSPIVEGENVEVHVVSDRLAPIEVSLEVTLMDFSGKKLEEVRQTINIPANSSTKFYELAVKNLLKNHSPNDVLLLTSVFENNTLLSENVLLLAPPKDLNLPKPALRKQIRQEVGGYSVTLQSDVFVKNVFLQLEGESFFSDNYFDLLPGEQLTVFCRTAVPLTTFEKELKMLTLGDEERSK